MSIHLPAPPGAIHRIGEPDPSLVGSAISYGLRQLMRKAVFARLVSTRKAGRFQVTVRAPGQVPVDITTVRGVPTQLSAMGFSDPFGPESLAFTLPAVSIFDAIGSGDLSWLVREADIDVSWIGALPGGYPWNAFRWEGFLTSFDYSSGGLAISCVGGLHQVDLYKAKPEYPPRPLPYEWAIARQFRDRPDLRVSAMKVEWPTWWKSRYTDPAKGTPGYLVPLGVKSGDNWTGLLTRSTGSWDDALSSYITSLLGAMYTERGRWTLDLDAGRVPVLRHRDMRFSPAPDIVVVDPAAPGNDLTLTEDWTQSINAVFGQSSSLSGVGYSGMQISPDGASTSYVPLAALRQVDPVGDKNGWYQRSRMRREVMLQLQEGLDEIDAQKVAAAHLARFGDPGYTGTLVLGSDPRLGGVVIPRALVRAGMSVQIPKILGSPDGLVLHVTQSSYDFIEGKTTLTVDSKYRDALTVDEVRVRGRDALSVTRMLVAGKYQPPVPDQVLPWSYSEGSGYIPSSADQSSLRLFRDMPPSVRFPWTDWTTQRPPKAAAWKSCYIRLAPANANADKNWSGVVSKTGTVTGIPIKMAQAGSIRLLQLAAYDRDGNVLPVDFHFSLYYSNGVNLASLPKLPADQAAHYPPYLAGQHYPFFPGAWEQYNADGTLRNPEQTSADAGAQLIQAWGSNYEKAGHWPGSFAAGDPATGLLVDESTFSFDTTRNDNTFDPYSVARTRSNTMAGKVYLMIYCDAQKEKEVFFAGRMFRAEPGTSS